MIQTAEQLIKTVRALPMSEKEKFFDLVVEEKLKVLLEKEAKNIELKEKNERFRRALQWIEEHKEEFDGQWVCLDGDKLVSHGFDGKKFMKKQEQKASKRLLWKELKPKNYLSEVGKCRK